MISVPDDGPCGNYIGPMPGLSGGDPGGGPGTIVDIEMPDNPCANNPSLAQCAYQVASQGAASPGKSCNVSGGTSASIGSVIQGPDVHNSEVNNVYFVAVGTGSSAGSLALYGGFFITTFGGTTWYQTPASIPGTNSVIYLSMGNNFGLAPNGKLSTASLVNFTTSALNMPMNSGLSAVVKKAVTDALNALAGKASAATLVPCFSGPWDGSALGLS